MDEDLQGERRKRATDARASLFNRQRAYLVVFDGGSELVKVVLEDLAKFCRADNSAFHADPRIHALIEGRREVWLRIQDHLKLDSEALWARYSGKGAAE